MRALALVAWGGLASCSGDGEMVSGSAVTAGPPSVQTVAPAVHVDRANHRLHVRDSSGKVRAAPIGTGRGGLEVKRSMGDYVTPTGTFVVDLVLHASGRHLAVAEAAREAAKGDPEYHALLADDAGLQRLFRGMNGLDFDGDGAADDAYGIGYVGLSGEQTGPKMSRFRGVARWFSIALHGTPSPEADLGASNSGGCVHVDETLLTDLIEQRVLRVGQVVTIADGAPEWGS